MFYINIIILLNIKISNKIFKISFNILDKNKLLYIENIQYTLNIISFINFDI